MVFSLMKDKDKGSKEGAKDQESIESKTTPELGHHVGKWQKHKKTSHAREPGGQSFPAGDRKATRNRQGSMTDLWHSITKRIHKRSTAFE